MRPEQATTQPPDSSIACRVLADHLTAWRQEWAAIDQMTNPAAGGAAAAALLQANERRWRLGLDMIPVIDAIGDSVPRMKLLEGMAAEFRCGIGHLYRMLDIARAFPESLPKQTWEGLYEISKWDAATRKELLSCLPDMAPLRRIPPRRRAKEVTPETEQAAKESARRQADVDEAKAAFEQVHPEERPYLLLDLLRGLDLNSLPASQRQWMVEQLQAVVSSFSRPAPSSAATGAAPGQSDASL